MGDTSRGVALGNGNKDIDFPDDSPQGNRLRYNEGPSEWWHGSVVIYPNGRVQHIPCKPEFHSASVVTCGKGISATEEWRCVECGDGASAHKEFVIEVAPEDMRENSIIECIKPLDCFATKDEKNEVYVYVRPGLADSGVWIVCWSDCLCRLGRDASEDGYRYVWYCRREEAEDPCDEDFMREIST